MKPADCAWCGNSFDSATRTKPRRYCSQACRLRAKRNQPGERAYHRRSKQRRRASLRGATVERFDDTEIFMRDNWRCGICGNPTNRTAKVPHPKAPTIDHLIPLAVGGDHVRTNVQCACFLCNSLKRDGTTQAGDQLRLIG